MAHIELFGFFFFILQSIRKLPLIFGQQHNLAIRGLTRGWRNEVFKCGSGIYVVPRMRGGKNLDSLLGKSFDLVYLDFLYLFQFLRYGGEQAPKIFSFFFLISCEKWLRISRFSREIKMQEKCHPYYLPKYIQQRPVLSNCVCPLVDPIFKAGFRIVAAAA